MSELRRCRLCGSQLGQAVVDLGAMPLANALLSASELASQEPRFPLRARLCDTCMLLQADDVVPATKIFDDQYTYFSSYSTTWMEHAARFADGARHRLSLSPESLVVEVASNDGYLLRHFAGAGVPVLGIEPAANVAAVAVEHAVPTEVGFFGLDMARDLVARGVRADLLVANNVLAHVPDLNDFAAGLATVLADTGSLSIEVPHLLRLIEGMQFDTLYHEHFSYFSLATARRALARHGLSVIDVEELPTHGGSLRIWAAHDDAGSVPSIRVHEVLDAEREAGLDDVKTYERFAERVDQCRHAVIDFLERARGEGAAVVAYGAAAKGTTLLNACGVTRDHIDYVVDRSPHKQGRFLPGTRLPVLPPETVDETRPDLLLILPWNLQDEITAQMAHIRDWGGRFVTAVPDVRVHA